MTQWAVGLDVGGTKIAGGIVSSQGDVIRRVVEPVRGVGEQAVADVLRVAQSLIEAAAEEGCPLSGVGLGVPGSVDVSQGLVLRAPALAWTRVPLGQIVAERIPLPVAVEHDVKAAALGELVFGQAAGLSNFIYITIGTGIGAGIILNGRPYYGTTWNSGEIGHTVLDPNGPLCSCGLRGCFEVLASGRAIGRRAARALETETAPSLLDAYRTKLAELDARAVREASRRRDELALRVIAEVVEYWGMGLSVFTNVFNPECLILGGGVIENDPELVDQIRAAVGRYTSCVEARPTPVYLISRPGITQVAGAAVPFLRERVGGLAVSF